MLDAVSTAKVLRSVSRTLVRGSQRTTYLFALRISQWEAKQNTQAFTAFIDCCVCHFTAVYVGLTRKEVAVLYLGINGTTIDCQRLNISLIVICNIFQTVNSLIEIC